MTIYACTRLEKYAGDASELSNRARVRGNEGGSDIECGLKGMKKGETKKGRELYVGCKLYSLSYLVTLFHIGIAPLDCDTRQA